MWQRIEIIGNLGRDPEMKYVNDKAVTSFSVAVNRKYGDTKTTVWFRVSAWNRLGEIAYEYLAKGRQVFVAGILMADQDTGGPKIFERNDGTTGSSFEILANEIQFLSGGERQTAREEAEQDEIPF